MGATREQIVVALFDRLKGAAPFVTASRRNQDPEGLDPALTPALFLLEHSDGWDRAQGYNMPAKRGMNLVAIIYIDVGPTDPNRLPATFLNTTIEAFEGLMAPDNVITDTFTLGGLVQACLIDGVTERASGDVTGKGLAVVPIRILIP